MVKKSCWGQNGLLYRIFQGSRFWLEGKKLLYDNFFYWASVAQHARFSSGYLSLWYNLDLVLSLLAPLNPKISKSDLVDTMNKAKKQLNMKRRNLVSARSWIHGTGHLAGIRCEWCALQKCDSFLYFHLVTSRRDFLPMCWLVIWFPLSCMLFGPIFGEP